MIIAISLAAAALAFVGALLIFGIIDTGTNLVITGVCSLVVWYLVRAALIAAMSNVQTAREAGEYLVKNSVKITGKSDTFVKKIVDRQPKRRK